MTDYRYTVWVGGVEVNDYYLTEQDAQELAQQYINDKYDDVSIEEVED